MMVLFLFLSTMLFFTFLLSFYYHVAVLGYHTRIEGTKKAGLFTVVTLAIYAVPQLLIGMNSAIFIGIVLWSSLWFVVIYKQTTATWQRVIR